MEVVISVTFLFLYTFSSYFYSVFQFPVQVSERLRYPFDLFFPRWFPDSEMRILFPQSFFGTPLEIP